MRRARRRAAGWLFTLTLASLACSNRDQASSAPSPAETQNAAGGAARGGTSAGGGGTSTPPRLTGGLGAHPAEGGPRTVGGSMTFTGVGAAGWWPRRLDREPSDSACDLKAGTDTWGGPCCLTRHEAPDTPLAPFDQEMTLLLKAVRLRQLAVYQPSEEEEWSLVSAWDDRNGLARNLWSTSSGDGSASLDGDLTRDDCVWYVAQAPTAACQDYFCPDDPGIKHLGWRGSKLIVMLASLDFDDRAVKSCGGETPGHPGPWIALVASELTRDGGRKWNGLCNCHSRNGSVGDGCGELNLFEVVMDNNEFSNREFMSTGLRSFQAGHVGGSVCGTGCSRDTFPVDQEVVDACAQAPFTQGPTLPVGGTGPQCPVWVRPRGDRYLVVLLDEVTRTLQVAVLHPEAVPAGISDLLPTLPERVQRSTLDRLAAMRLPEGD